MLGGLTGPGPSTAVPRSSLGPQNTSLHTSGSRWSFSHSRVGLHMFHLPLDCICTTICVCGLTYLSLLSLLWALRFACCFPASVKPHNSSSQARTVFLPVGGHPYVAVGRQQVCSAIELTVFTVCLAMAFFDVLRYTAEHRTDLLR